MKKQLLFISCGVLMSTSVGCMEPGQKLCPPIVNKPYAEFLQLAKEELGSNSTKVQSSDPEKSFLDRHVQELQEEQSRIAQFREQDEEKAGAKKEQNFDALALLQQSNFDSQHIRKLIDCSAQCIDPVEFAKSHSELTNCATEFYMRYLTEKAKAKISVNSPAYNALLYKAYGHDRMAAAGNAKILAETVYGLYVTLANAKDRANKK